MIMITTDTGYLEIKNIPKYQPFLVQYEDLDDAIQVDITGIGVLKYFNTISEDLKLEITTNINNQLVKYQKTTGHNAADIGFSITYQPNKKLNSNTNTVVTGVDISIFFKKPVKNASAYSLQPTITLISLILLNEIFHLTT